MPFSGTAHDIKAQERSQVLFAFTVYRDTSGNFQLIGLRGGTLTVAGTGLYDVDLPGRGDYIWMQAFANPSTGTGRQVSVATPLPGAQLNLELLTSTGGAVDLANTEAIHVMVVAHDKEPHNYDAFA